MKNAIRVFPLPHDILEDTKFKTLLPSEKITYIYLAKLSNHFADAEGWFWRSEITLMVDTGLSRNTLINAIKKLQVLGFIEVKRGRYEHSGYRSPNYYKINGFRYRKDS